MENYPKDVHVDFILERMREGEKWKEVRAKFLAKWIGISKGTFDNRWAAALVLHQAEQREIKALANGEIAKKAEMLKDSIMTQIERQIVLSEMARGEVRVQKPIVINNEPDYLEHWPDFKDRKNAITELNKMDGAYIHKTPENQVRFIVAEGKRDDD